MMLGDWLYFQILFPQKLLSSDEFSKACRKFRKGKRKPKEQRYFPPEIPHHKNAKRSLASEFANCGQHGPPVDPWVLQTLGLKDLNTIDDILGHIVLWWELESVCPARSKMFSSIPDLHPFEASSTPYSWSKLSPEREKSL